MAICKSLFVVYSTRLLTLYAKCPIINSGAHMTQPSEITWDLVPFIFTLNWIFDFEFGWLEVCWLPDS